MRKEAVTEIIVPVPIFYLASPSYLLDNSRDNCDGCLSVGAGQRHDPANCQHPQRPGHGDRPQVTGRY